MGRYWGTVLTMAWLMFAVLFWALAFNIAVLYIQRFHGAPKEYIKKNFCSRDIIKPEDEVRLLTADREESTDPSKKTDYEHEFSERRINKSLAED